MKEMLQHLPAVDQVLGLESTQDLLGHYRRDYVVDRIRQVLGEVRAAVLEADENLGRGELLRRVEEQLARAVEQHERPSLRRAINATGVILHTGLGRAPLPPAALLAVREAAEHYCNLEFDLDRGKRGSRLDHVEQLICRAARSEAAAVVNNNAAAVLLILNTLARDREVIVSRGQLVEIGGSFRIPDIISASGARIREVGTTNRTHLRDYEAAINADTALVLLVHPSNYRVRGFTAEVELGQLVALTRRAGLPLVYDLGGGVLFDLRDWELPHEPVVRDCLDEGADLVSFSGDKVLGGPQAGIIAGSREHVESIRENPLMRALRCDKLILAALEASLRIQDLAPEALRQAHPVLRMMSEPVEAVERRARDLLNRLPAPVQLQLRASIEPSLAQAGSGALPLAELPSRAVALRPAFCGVEALARSLRLDQEAVVGRISREALLLDMRTVRDDELEPVAASLVRAANASG